MPAASPLTPSAADRGFGRGTRRRLGDSDSIRNCNSRRGRNSLRSSQGRCVRRQRQKWQESPLRWQCQQQQASRPAAIMPAALPLAPSTAARGFGRGTDAGSVGVTSGTATAIVGVVVASEQPDLLCPWQCQKWHESESPLRWPCQRQRAVAVSGPAGVVAASIVLSWIFNRSCHEGAAPVHSH